MTGDLFSGKKEAPRPPQGKLVDFALSALTTRITNFVRTTILSVLLPGFVILVEVWFLVGSSALPEEAKNNRVLAVVVVGYFAYITGFFGRELSFFLSEGLRHAIMDRWRRDKRARLDAPFGTRHWGGGFFNEAAFRQNYELLLNTFGSERVKTAMLRHPVGDVIIAESTKTNQDYREVFHYCKAWLRRNAPDLSTDNLEVEFNVNSSSMLPVLLAPFALWGLSGEALAAAVALPIAILVVIVLYQRGKHLRHAEVFDVMRNLLFDQWFRETRAAATSAEEVKPEANA